MVIHLLRVSSRAEASGMRFPRRSRCPFLFAPCQWNKTGLMGRGIKVPILRQVFGNSDHRLDLRPILRTSRLTRVCRFLIPSRQEENYDGTPYPNHDNWGLKVISMVTLEFIIARANYTVVDSQTTHQISQSPQTASWDVTQCFWVRCRAKPCIFTLYLRGVPLIVAPEAPRFMCPAKVWSSVSRSAKGTKVLLPSA
jgi:hypothetical protein